MNNNETTKAVVAALLLAAAMLALWSANLFAAPERPSYTVNSIAPAGPNLRVGLLYQSGPYGEDYIPRVGATPAPPGSGGLQAYDKCLDDQGRVITGEQAEAANLASPWGEIVSISPDGHWLLCHRHYGSHWGENYLYRSDDGVRFVPAQKELNKNKLESRRRYASEISNTSHFETAEEFGTKAWDFARAVEHIKVTKPVDVYPAEFVSWSSDSAKLLFSLTGRLNNTGKELTVDPNSGNDQKKPGVGLRAYYNMRTQHFELTDELRATNKEARKRWSEGK